MYTMITAKLTTHNYQFPTENKKTNLIVFTDATIKHRVLSYAV